MNMKNERPYKTAEPLCTINRIRNALEKCGLFTTERCFYGLPANVSCTRVMVGDEDLLSFGAGTNGKGMTMRYALASAYAEFMERLQNGVLFPNRQLKFSSELFRFGPDEVSRSVSQVLEECEDILNETFGFLSQSDVCTVLKRAYEENTTICAPFYDAFKNKVRCLPVEMIYNFTGTNGMCSGNTPAEAIAHGICEIMERYAMREIYMKRINPPKVPDKYFEGTQVLSRLKMLEASGYTFEIRDCSLNKKLPVLGLLLKNDEGEFTFHLGADLRPEIALERCLTEIFQGSRDDIEERFTKTTLEFPSNREEMALYCRQFCDATIRGTSPWPSAIFENNPTYPFTGISKCGKNDEEDLRILVNLLKESGYGLFIRDVSYLGFPSYYVYIPKMSELDLIYDDGNDFIATIQLANLQKAFISPQVTSKNVRKKITETIEYLLYEGISTPLLPNSLFLLNTSRQLYNFDNRLISALFAAGCDMLEVAGKNMTEYLNLCKASYNRKLCNALSVFWKEKEKKTSDNDIKQLMGHLFDSKTVDVCIEYGDSEKIFDLFDWPECFRCEDCMQNSTCRYTKLIEVMKSVQQSFKQNIPLQENLMNLFVKQ